MHRSWGACAAALAGVLLPACGDDAPAGPGGGAGASGAGGDGGAGSGGAGGAPACPAFEELVVVGETRPGATVELRVAPERSATGYEAAFSVTVGAASATAEPGVASWSLPADVGTHLPVAATAHVTVTRTGCDAIELSTEVSIAWPDAARVIVLYDPDVDGSSEVAEAYRAFRGMDAAQLCAVTSPDPTVLPGEDYEAFLDQVAACVAAVGPHVHYLVPVWGVPYKVSGRIGDLADPASPVTVSLDALLFFAGASKALTQPEPNPIHQPGDSLEGVYDPHQPFGELRAADPAERWLVARIDGADAQAAIELVNRTAAAEALAAQGQLAGTVYVDGNRGLPHPATDDFGSYEGGEWNIIGVENVFAAADLYPIVADYHGAEFGTAPAPLTCPDALYYAGWYSFGNYNDVFEWQPGAIGGHLDSCSACDIRGDKDWSARALRRGITATFGAVNEPYVAGMPEYDQFFSYLLAGASYGEAAYQSTVFGAWMMVWIGDPLYRPYASAR